jgi:hypothetical protein
MIMSAKKTKENEKENEEAPESRKELLKNLTEDLDKLKDARRPEINNPNIPEDDLKYIEGLMYNAYVNIRDFAANLRPLDRRRLNSIGTRTMGFVEKAYDFAMENARFLPQFLTAARFTRDYDYFKRVRALFDQAVQIRELLWNITIQAADVAYTDALDYYDAVRSAGKCRVDGAESIYRQLETFFRRPKRTDGEPTKKQIERDMKAYLDGKRDGKIIVENISPKVTAGKHKVIDEKYADSAVVHETKDAEFKE